MPAVRTRQLNPFARWLREIRADKKLTRDQMAAFLGVKPGYLKGLENKDQLPRPEMLTLIEEKTKTAVPEDIRAWIDKTRQARKFLGNTTPVDELPPFGRIIRSLRQSRGLTIPQVSVALGHHKKYMERIEVGRRKVPERTVRALASYFGYSEVPEQWREALIAGGQVEHTHTERQNIPPLGAVWRAYRKSHLLTHEKMAQRCQMSKPKYMRLELGTQAVSDEAMLMVAQAMGYEEIPENWFQLRQASKQVPMDNSGELHDHLSPLGYELRSIRKELNCSQVELARHLDKSTETISELEFGRLRLKEKEFKMLCSYLGGSDTEARLRAAMKKCPQWQVPKGVPASELTTEGLKHRQARLARGLTRGEMAEEENTTVWQIIKREKGEKKSWRQRKLLKETMQKSDLADESTER